MFLRILLFILMQTICLARPITVALEWLLSPHHFPLIIADLKGFFEEENLQVSLVGSIGSSENCRLAACRKLDYAITSEPKLEQMQKKGIHLRSVYTLIPKCMTVFASHYPLDKLKGKTIGYPSSQPDVIIKAVLRRYKEGDVRLMYVQQAFVTSFIARTIDAVSGIWDIYEGETIRRHCKNVYFYSCKDLGVAEFSDVIIITGAQNKESDEPFKKALSKAIAFVKKNPQEAFDLCIKKYPELNTELNQKTWKKFIKMFS